MKAIKVIEYRDVDFETAKKEVAGYFQMKGEAYASEIEEDLELDYRLRNSRSLLVWFSCAFGDMVIQIARRPLQPGSGER